MATERAAAAEREAAAARQDAVVARAELLVRNQFTVAAWCAAVWLVVAPKAR
jgi:hypothetical protein